MYTLDGKKYLDFCAGIATCALGHSNEDLTNAISKQMQTVHHVSNLYYIPQQAQLAQWLCDNSVADKVFFCNSGAEANEAAIKLARRNASNKGITVCYRKMSLLLVSIIRLSKVVLMLSSFGYFFLPGSSYHLGDQFFPRSYFGSSNSHRATQIPQRLWLWWKDGSGFRIRRVQ